MAHKALPPQDTDKLWDDFVSKTWEQQSQSPNLADRALAVPMTLGGMGAYGVARGADQVMQLLNYLHMLQQVPKR